MCRARRCGTPGLRYRHVYVYVCVQGETQAPNRVLVRWKRGVATPQALRAGARLQRTVGVTGRTKVYSVPAGTSVEQTVAELKANPGAAGSTAAEGEWLGVRCQCGFCRRSACPSYEAVGGCVVPLGGRLGAGRKGQRPPS